MQCPNAVATRTDRHKHTYRHQHTQKHKNAHKITTMANAISNKFKTCTLTNIMAGANVCAQDYTCTKTDTCTHLPRHVEEVFMYKVLMQGPSLVGHPSIRFSDPVGC